MKRSAKEQKGIEYYMGLPYSILLHEIKEDGEKYWIAEVPALPGCKSHGSNVEEAVKSVEEAKKDWILDSLKEGEGVPIPVERDRYSGKILVRMSRSLHRSLALIAEAEKLSLNQLIVTILAKEAGRLSVLNRVEDKVDNLLQKIDHVLEEEGIRIPFSKSIHVMSQSQERGQYFMVDALGAAGAGQTTEDLGLATAIGGVVTSGFVTTDSPFEGLWRYQSPVQYPGQQRVVYSTKKVGEDDMVESEHK